MTSAAIFLESALGTEFIIRIHPQNAVVITRPSPEPGESDCDVTRDYRFLLLPPPLAPLAHLPHPPAPRPSFVIASSSASCAQTTPMQRSCPIKGANIHKTPANIPFFPSPTPSTPRSAHLHASLNKTLGRVQLANDAPSAATLPFSSKAPPLPKELAEDLLNENKNKLVHAAITASRADPVLANAREIAFTKALSKVESKCVFRLHSRNLQLMG
ncbi:hypothetical protein ARMGADRAFT_1075092 [Armillaria gallica]|uniref:Uncharacterized protein n=1 Tax=Armillaria gallica TaxID=47427 RepID=A0A2H3DWJ3_ARMGA|nr:hypothetical protein ARMGADRAFT_1075092 [Armillaria gallica]